MAENSLAVKLVESYLHILHFTKGSVNVSTIILLPEHPFNIVNVKECFKVKI